MVSYGLLSAKPTVRLNDIPFVLRRVQDWKDREREIWSTLDPNLTDLFIYDYIINYLLYVFLYFIFVG